MATLLQALLHNESGGRNIANTTEGTSSGQAQGYFQITTGTWNDFGGQKYAPEPMRATYAQQAEVASRIPLKRWDESTVALMRSTGRQVDPNRTLGENLAANGESLQGAPRISGPVEAAGGGAGSDVGAPTLYDSPQPTDVASAFSFINTSTRDDEPIPLVVSRERSLADELSDSVTGGNERRQADDTDSGLLYGPEDETAQTGPLDFGVPPTAETGEQAPPAPMATSPSSATSSLADLFTVKDIGQASMVDPRTGVPATGRRRRAYG